MNWLAILFVGALFTVVLIVAIAPTIIQHIYGFDPPCNVGQFGDQFGVVNALFTALAFVGVIAAILLQKRELELQREELHQTKEELRGQKEQLAAQNKTFQQQTFENTFFQLLRLHNDIVESLSVPLSNRSLTGRDCFRHLYFQGLYNRLKGETRANNYQGVLEQINRIYLNFHKNEQHILGHYFRNLYNILKFIANSSVEDPMLYANLVRAQLSTFELLLLFYSCLSDLGRERFKPLIERFGFLEGIAEDQLANTEDMGFYQPDAFPKS